ncbi:MAG TPA: 5-dehydro-2-deoxygluconokinase [Dermatophilaceae bacterium]|nr:5-dehydro-2-deoxygluconokinase [Dermatophilaceae bacterium]
MPEPDPPPADDLDLLCIGRIGVDVYPLQVGMPLEQVSTFGKFLGGSATNVAVAAARHGRRAAIVTGVGDDPFGRFARRALRDLGVDDRFVQVDADLPTPVTFCEIFPPDDFPLYFYRRPSAPDLQMTPDSLPQREIRAARVLWTTLTGLCQQPSRAAHEAAWAARGRTRHTVIDLDYRAVFWGSETEATAAAGLALAAGTVAVGNLEECRVAVGESDPDRAAAALLERGVELAVVKLGPRGVLAVTATDRVLCPPVPVEVVNGLGAGDAFGGALVHGLLAGWPLAETIEFASTAGAIVAGRLECSTAMPTEAEVRAYPTGDR